MITIRLIDFKKDVNSTAIPDNAAIWDDEPGNIREPCNLLSPSIAFDFGALAVAPTYNYSYIDAFKRYYHIVNWTFVGSLWIASMQVDVLATYRADIGASTQYVARAAARYNGAITDTAYVATSNITVSATSIQTPWALDVGQDGYYVIGVVSGAEDSVGGISYYALTGAAMRAFRKKLFSVDIFDGVTTIGTDVAQLIYDPFSYITSCMWFPFAPPRGGIQTGIDVGFVRLTGVAVAPLTANPVYANSIAFDFPRHPQSAARGSYLNAAPWSSYYVWYPPFGQVPISSDLALVGGSVRCSVRVDCITGEGWLSIQTADGVPVDHVQAQVGVPVAITSVSGLGQVAHSAVNTAMGTNGSPNIPASPFAEGTVGDALIDTLARATEWGNNVKSAVKPAVAAIASHFADGTTMRMTGTNGSIMIYNQLAYLVCTFTRAAGDDNERLGRPLCEMARLDTLPGYQLITRPHVKFARTLDENRQIESYMAGGYFYD